MLKEEAWHLGSSSSSGGGQPTSFLVCNETWGMPTQESAHLFMAPLLMPSKKCQQPECLPPNTDCQAAGWTITQETPLHVFGRELLPGLAEVRDRVIPSTEYGTELFKWSVRRAPAFTALSGATVTTHCLTLLLRDRHCGLYPQPEPSQPFFPSRLCPVSVTAMGRQCTRLTDDSKVPFTLWTIGSEEGMKCWFPSHNEQTYLPPTSWCQQLCPLCPVHHDALPCLAPKTRSLWNTEP